jgi:DNA repair protein RadC
MYRSKEGVSLLQPREKAIEYGIKKLSDRELISILLGTGSKENPVFKLANKILLLLDQTDGEISMINLQNIKGVGKAKATLIVAALEFSRRRLGSNSIKVSYPTDILPAVRHYVTRAQEYFIVISLNGAHEIIKTRVVSIGLLNRTLIHPREVFSDALKDRAASLIVGAAHFPSSFLIM